MSRKSSIAKRTHTLLQTRVSEPPIVRVKSLPAKSNATSFTPTTTVISETMPEKTSAARVQAALLASMQQRAKPFTSFFKVVETSWRWIAAKRQEQLRGKRLRVIETVSLGEKRFAAVLHVDGAQFLIGGGPNNISLLASLQAEPSQNEFADVLHQQTAQGPIL